MTRVQLFKAVTLALSDADLSNADDSIFDGFGLRDFAPVTCTVRQLAKLVRWQSVQLNGEIDAEALNEISNLGRTRFNVLD